MDVEMSYDNALYKSILHYITLHYIQSVRPSVRRTCVMS